MAQNAVRTDIAAAAFAAPGARAAASGVETVTPPLHAAGDGDVLFTDEAKLGTWLEVEVLG